jgi:hypothetical protein
VGFILEVDCFSASSKMMFVIMFVGYERDEGLDVSLVVMSWLRPAAHGVLCFNSTGLVLCLEVKFKSSYSSVDWECSYTLLLFDLYGSACMVRM